MRFICLTTVAVAMLLTTTTSPAFAAGCCEGAAMTCCKHAAAPTTACCEQQSTPTEDTIDVFFKIDPNAIRWIEAGLPPARQTAAVWFERPVWVGDKVLMGKYVIEHDTDRQARGEPCTHIYAANDPITPVVAFHCTHLDRDERAQKNTVVLRPLPDGTRKFVEFQFAGEDAAHGYPTER